MLDLDVQTLASNLVEGFNRNLFDRDQQFYLKTEFFKYLKFEKLVRFLQ